jgi:hypothetical protein
MQIKGSTYAIFGTHHGSIRKLKGAEHCTAYTKNKKKKREKKNI